MPAQTCTCRLTSSHALFALMSASLVLLWFLFVCFFLFAGGGGWRGGVPPFPSFDQMTIMSQCITLSENFTGSFSVMHAQT